jgi:hypothetical protein
MDEVIQEFEYNEFSSNPFEIRLITLERVEKFEAPMPLRVFKQLLSSPPSYFATFLYMGSALRGLPRNLG